MNFLMAAIGHHRYKKQVGTLQLCRMDGTKILLCFSKYGNFTEECESPT